MDNFTIFDMLYEDFKFTKPIRLIECFAGYGSQAMSLKRLGLDFEHWKICEWATKSIQAYKDVHFTNDNTDYSKDLTQEQVVEYLAKKGVSMNYNEPMSLDQIKRKGEEWQRQTYNNIIATHNLVNISQVKGKDLEIVETDKYDYILTYSFPCQDLSLAGKRAGMEKDSGTRSGLLWEVERILDECKELGTLPKILLMENVPEVVGANNIEHFKKWRLKLEQLGYSNYDKILNAKDFGIPQNRKRCFMISILGEYNYSFPQELTLKLKLKDMLEDNVDEKYYLSQKMIEYISQTGTQNFSNPDCKINLDIGRPLTTGQNKRAGTTNYICNELPNNYDLKEVKRVGGLFDKDGKKHQAGSVYDSEGLSPTLDTANGGYRQPCVVVNDKNSLFTETEKQLFTEDGNIKRYINSDIVDECKEGQMATTTFPNGYGHGPRTHDESIALNTIDKPVVKQNLCIRKLTPRECGRLMGVSDDDITKMAQNQSDASLYHLFGDSIVVDVLYYIFKQMM